MCGGYNSHVEGNVGLVEGLAIVLRCRQTQSRERRLDLADIVPRRPLRSLGRGHRLHPFPDVQKVQEASHIAVEDAGQGVTENIGGQIPYKRALWLTDFQQSQTLQFLDGLA